MCLGLPGTARMWDAADTDDQLETLVGKAYLAMTDGPLKSHAHKDYSCLRVIADGLGTSRSDKLTELVS